LVQHLNIVPLICLAVVQLQLVLAVAVVVLAVVVAVHIVAMSAAVVEKGTIKLRLQMSHCRQKQQQQHRQSIRWQQAVTSCGVCVVDAANLCMTHKAEIQTRRQAFTIMHPVLRKTRCLVRLPRVQRVPGQHLRELFLTGMTTRLHETPLKMKKTALSQHV
jgi:hypothetical protein